MRFWHAVGVDHSDVVIVKHLKPLAAKWGHPESVAGICNHHVLIHAQRQRWTFLSAVFLDRDTFNMVRERKAQRAGVDAQVAFLTRVNDRDINASKMQANQRIPSELRESKREPSNCLTAPDQPITRLPILMPFGVVSGIS